MYRASHIHTSHIQNSIDPSVCCGLFVIISKQKRFFRCRCTLRRRRPAIEPSPHAARSRLPPHVATSWIRIRPNAYIPLMSAHIPGKYPTPANAYSLHEWVNIYERINSYGKHHIHSRAKRKESPSSRGSFRFVRLVANRLATAERRRRLNLTMIIDDNRNAVCS